MLKKGIEKTIKKYSVGWGFPDCNMGCKHCYNASRYAGPHYTFDELKAIADNICPRTSAINFGTGEMVFNPNTMSLLCYIAEKYPEVALAVTSNGSLVKFCKPETLQLFHDIDFSLDFPDPERHNAFRRHEFAWEMIMESLIACRDLAIPFSIVTCVTGQTSDDDLIRLFGIAKEYGASWRANWFRPTGRGAQCDSMRLSARRVWEILELIVENMYITAMADPLFDAVIGTGYRKQPGCACGVNSCRIQTTLDVTPCVFLGGGKWSGGKVSEKSLDEIFNSENFRQFNTRNPIFCQACGLKVACRGGCSSRAILYLDDHNMPDPFCPFFSDVPYEIVESVKDKVDAPKNDGNLIHANYLCTMIADPK